MLWKLSVAILKFNKPECRVHWTDRSNLCHCGIHSHETFLCQYRHFTFLLNLHTSPYKNPNKAISSIRASWASLYALAVGTRMEIIYHGNAKALVVSLSPSGSHWVQIASKILSVKLLLCPPRAY